MLGRESIAEVEESLDFDSSTASRPKKEENKHVKDAVNQLRKSRQSRSSVITSVPGLKKSNDQIDYRKNAIEAISSNTGMGMKDIPINNIID